ncbi:MAG: RNA polymerase sigma factor [Candidatus Nealsonbacteria bacterium DGGOD1a]|jgi:RNA polymerase sigma factor, sigma-70 family|nr:MAG: RNA polymerase sigma factor [Candidatus Nealsonbacteria bacterium DGGOD1a]
MDKIQGKFSRIYDDHVEKIYRFVFLRVNSKEIAQDLTSETFAKGWESYKTNPNEIKNPRAFLYKIAKNLVIDHYRAKAKIQTVSPELVESQLADTKVDLEQRAVLASDMETVRKAMVDLNEDYQNAIIWRYLEDMPIKEVSHLLDRSEEATRVLLHRAMKELRTKLS